ncbi:MAG: hypothetical protein ACHQ2F_13395, partial [Desulfobaccales bacterium]
FQRPAHQHRGVLEAGLLELDFRVGEEFGLGSLGRRERDRNRQGAALSELANEGTWLLVTLAWLLK